MYKNIDNTQQKHFMLAADWIDYWVKWGFSAWEYKHNLSLEYNGEALWHKLSKTNRAVKVKPQVVPLIVISDTERCNQATN